MMEIQGEEKQSFKPLPPGYKDKRINTTSTMFIGTSPAAPNIKTVILACSSILHNLMLDDIKASRTVTPSDPFFLFSEERYFHSKALSLEQIEHLRQMPTIQNIYEFIKTLNNCAEFGPECCICALVYINRFFNKSGSPLLPCNWRPIVLSSLIVAKKVWQDVNVVPTDFSLIFPFFAEDQIFRLEEQFISMIGYNLSIKRSIYLRYYFELRSLVKSEDEFPEQPLDNITADRLQSFSKLVESRQRGKVKDKRAMTQPYPSK